MTEDFLLDTQTQTQTQNSQQFSQLTPSAIPTIWGRLHPITDNLTANDKHCWKSEATNLLQKYYDLSGAEHSFGRAQTCSFIMKRVVVKERIMKIVSKENFILKRDTSALSPAIIYDLSHNGTFVNGEKIGKGKCRVLDHNDEISITHPRIKMFVFKDLLKNEQDKVPPALSKKYYVSKTIGHGACGVVKQVYNKFECTKFAMKVIKKKTLSNGQMDPLNDPEKIMNEVNILKSLKHPGIISTEEVFDTPDSVYIVMELMEGGELFDRITALKRFSERTTKLLFRQIVLAVKYLHSQGITHRDLKPENVLLESREHETLVKLSDFGLSKLVGEQSFMHTRCGTPLYLAPEVMLANGKRAYGRQVDVWSLGVIFFVCLSGYVPFSEAYKPMSLEEQIIHGRIRFSYPEWEGVSRDAIRLMRRMLTVDPAERITLDQILEHKWMQDPYVINRVNDLMRQQSPVSGDSSMPGPPPNQENIPTPTQNNPGPSVLAPNIPNSSKPSMSKLGETNPAKRCLSNESKLTDPIPKRMRLGLYPVRRHRTPASDTDSNTTEDDCWSPVI